MRVRACLPLYCFAKISWRLYLRLRGNFVRPAERRCKLISADFEVKTYASSSFICLHLAFVMKVINYPIKILPAIVEDLFDKCVDL